MWERELEIIESLGKLYPKFGYVQYKNWNSSNHDKSRWIYHLCEYHLKRRLSHLEKFIKENGDWVWGWYKLRFEITDEQCGVDNEIKDE